MSISQGGIAFFGGRQLRGKDFTALRIDREVELAPGPLATFTLLFGQPLAGAVHLQPGRVDHDMDRPCPLGLCQRTGER